MGGRVIISYLLLGFTYVLALYVVHLISSDQTNTVLQTVTLVFFVLSIVYVTLELIFSNSSAKMSSLGTMVGVFFLRLLVILGLVLFLRKDEISLSKMEILFIVGIMIIFMILEKFIVLNGKLLGTNK